MTGTSSSRSDKSGKNNKDLPLANVKDEFASSPKSCMKIEHEILKENHETLKIDYESLQKRVKLSEETYEAMKKLSQSKTGELEVRNARLVEDCVRERNDKDKYKKIVEEMKSVGSERKAKIDELRRKEEEMKKTESERKAMIDELRKREEEMKKMESERRTMIDDLKKREDELLMAKRKWKEDEERKLENKFVELAERFVVIEADCSYLKSLYDADVAASGTANLISHGGNEVNNNAKNDVTEGCNISTQRSVDRRSQENITPGAVTNHSPPFSASPSSSSSSSSSDGYDVVFKRPANWPEWAMPKGHGDDSNKS